MERRVKKEELRAIHLREAIELSVLFVNSVLHQRGILADVPGDSKQGRVMRWHYSFYGLKPSSQCYAQKQ